METQAEYIVETPERESLMVLLAEGQKKLEEQQKAEREQEKILHAEKLRNWQEALAPIRARWPWMEEYIEAHEYDLPSVGSFFLLTCFPGFAPISIAICRDNNFTQWELDKRKEFGVYRILPGQYPAWDFSTYTNYPDISTALAVAKELGDKFKTRGEAYLASQLDVDRQQTEELAKNEDDNPEYRLLGALHEIIQNEICHTCSRCG